MNFLCLYCTNLYKLLTVWQLFCENYYHQSDVLQDNRRYYRLCAMGGVLNDISVNIDVWNFRYVLEARNIVNIDWILVACKYLIDWLLILVLFIIE